MGPVCERIVVPEWDFWQSHFFFCPLEGLAPLGRIAVCRLQQGASRMSDDCGCLAVVQL